MWANPWMIKEIIKNGLIVGFVAFVGFWCFAKVTYTIHKIKK